MPASTTRAVVSVAYPGRLSKRGVVERGLWCVAEAWNSGLMLVLTGSRALSGILAEVAVPLGRLLLPIIPTSSGRCGGLRKLCQRRQDCWRGGRSQSGEGPRMFRPKGEPMWCSTCQQDVPGVRSSVCGALVCVRCGQQADEQKRPLASDHPSTPEERERLLRNLEHWSDHPLLAELDDWELGEQLRHVERLLAMARPADSPTPPHFPWGDAAHAPPGPYPVRGGAGGVVALTPLRAARLLAWCALALGLAAVVCGAVLMAMAQLRGRSDLWGVGIPLFAVGQLGLVIGLVCEADLARRGRRRRVHSSRGIGRAVSTPS